MDSTAEAMQKPPTAKADRGRVRKESLMRFMEGHVHTSLGMSEKGPDSVDWNFEILDMLIPGLMSKGADYTDDDREGIHGERSHGGRSFGC